MIVTPRYLAGSLADVLPGVLTALGVSGQCDRLGLADRLAGVRRVAVLLIDGMGWHQLPLMASPGSLIGSCLSGQVGEADVLTCGFPSTTPTGLVSLGTGALPGAHGVMAFTTVIPDTDVILNHTMWTDDPPPSSWVPVPTLFSVAAKAGVAVTIVTRPLYEGSGLTTAYCGGGSFRGAADADALAAGILDALAEATGPALVYGYHPELDKAGHESGIDSLRWRAAASEVDRLLARIVDGLPPDAALLVTADHGQLEVPADRRIDVAADPRLLAGVRLFAGEPRVRYLHTEPGAEADVLAAWREVAGHAAWIGTRQEAVDTGWYGPVPPEHARRLGDLVVVCKEDWAVLSTSHDHAGVRRLIAMHGSLTAAEMEIPLLAFRGDSALPDGPQHG